MTNDRQDDPPMFDLPRLTRRVAPVVAPRRDVDFDALAIERRRFTDKTYEATRVRLHEQCANHGENFFYLAMSFQPYLWADMYNAAEGEYEQIAALCALEVWRGYRRGDYAMVFVEAVKS